MWAGATPKPFWAALGRKSGVAPAQSGVFFCVTFLILVSFISPCFRDLSASQGEEGCEDEAEVRNSYLLHPLCPNSRRAPKETSCWAGATLGINLATEPCAKVGSPPPAQHKVLPASKLIVAPCATSCSLGTCSIGKVTARVTHVVIWVFHAHFTFPCCESRLFEIVMPHISKRPRK